MIAELKKHKQHGSDVPGCLPCCQYPNLRKACPSKAGLSFTFKHGLSCKYPTTCRYVTDDAFQSTINPCYAPALLALKFRQFRDAVRLDRARQAACPRLRVSHALSQSACAAHKKNAVGFTLIAFYTRF